MLKIIFSDTTRLQVINKAKYSLFVLFFVYSYTSLQAQIGKLLHQERGVSLSYTYSLENTISCLDYKLKQYKVTVYLTNNSGGDYQIGFTTEVDHHSYWTGARLDILDKCEKACDFNQNNPIADFTSSEIMHDKSTLTLTYYLFVLDSDPFPEPAWNFGQGEWIKPKTDKEEPTQPNQNNNSQQSNQTPQWSDWITGNCYKGLSYQYRVTELVNLNYQVWYEFKVRSSYKETVQFVLSLKDENGTERFGTKNRISAGGEMTFTEKMDKNYIKTLGIDKVWFPADVGKSPSACDDERDNAKNNNEKNNQQDKGKFDNFPSMMPPGEWSIVREPECYGGIGYSVRHNGYLKENKGYRWSINFNNYYNAPVSFSYRMIMKNGDDEASEWQYATLDPTDRNRGGGIFFGGRDVTTSDWDHLEVKEVCFSGTSCKQTGCYAACDIQDKVPNKNCKDGSSPNDKTDADKKEKDAKAAQLKKENDDLVVRIQADINQIPAAQTKSQLQGEFNNIRSAATDDEAKNSQLKSFETKVNSAAEQINANKEGFENDKKQTEENINNIRSQNEEIKKAQTQYMSGWTGFLTAIFSMKGRSGKGSSYQGGSSKISLKMGINFMNQPVGYNEHTQGSNYYPGTGARTYFNTKEFKDESIMAPGFYFLTEIHPYYSTNFSIGFTGGFSFGYWPEANNGNNDVTSNFAGNSSSTVLNFNYGVEVTAGARPVKLLMRYHIHNHQVTTGGITGSTYNGSNYQSEYNTYYDTDQKWKMTWAALGLRFGNYLKSKTFVDVALTRYIPTQVLGLKTVYKNSDLYNANHLKIPVGAYVQISTQNGIYVRAEYAKDNIIVDDELKQTSVSKKTYFNIVFGRSWEWFGKPYSKKVAQKKK